MIDRQTISVDTLLVDQSSNSPPRIDSLLAGHFPSYSRTYFQELIERGFVTVNGLPIKKRYRLNPIDLIEVSFQPLPTLDVVAEQISLDILYEDDHLLAINKPQQMVVHPAPGAYTGTFANALLYHCQTLSTEEFDPLRPGIVHRIDKDTTGVLLAAKTRQAHQTLVAQFAARRVDKRYLAICCGSPREGRFSAPIGRDPKDRKRMAIRPDGKEAVTLFRTEKSGRGLSLVEATLLTGRTHQIRVHLRELRTPILGDSVYGDLPMNRKWQIDRQQLHAYSISFSHPETSLPMTIRAPIPENMKNFIDLIQLS